MKSPASSVALGGGHDRERVDGDDVRLVRDRDAVDIPSEAVTSVA